MKKCFKYFLVIFLLALFSEFKSVAYNAGIYSDILNNQQITMAAYAQSGESSKSLINKVNENLSYQEETNEIKAAEKAKKKIDFFKIIINIFKFLIIVFSIILVTLFFSTLFKRQEAQKKFNSSRYGNNNNVVSNDEREISDLSSAVVSFVKHRLKP